MADLEGGANSPVVVHRPARPCGGVTYGSAAVFWAGITSLTVGVLLHLPMYVGAGDVHYRLAGMKPDPPMIVGMALIVVGIAATAYGLFPKAAAATQESIARLRVGALDDTPIRPAHIGLLVVMALAVTIDVMKPTALAFVVPGFAREYGLRSPANPGGHPAAALLPLAGLTGTVVGSFLWGWLADRSGRRASILLAGVLFMATSVCGSMPSYRLNLAMCFIMGLAAGGMLPITFALMAETIPARHRGWLMVLIGGDVAGAYIITSWLSSTLVPHYTWRVLWLLGLPTGLLLIVLNRWIPESPRFLVATGRDEEARAVMARYGAVLEDQPPDPAAGAVKGGFAQLFRFPFAGLTTVVVLLAIGAGLVAFGFQLWIPSNLQKLGYTQVTADKILRDSALIGFPLNFVVAWLYGFWSSTKTIAIVAALTAVALFGFVLGGDQLARNSTALHALLVVPIWGISSVVAVLAAYSSEIYPTRVRSHGTGLAAGASKAGGVLVVAVVVAAVATPSIAATATAGAVPLAAAAVGLVMFGVETRRRGLEEITAEQLHDVGVAG